MADFYSNYNDALTRSDDNMTLTENGDLTYKGVGDDLTDFYLSKMTMRNKADEEVQQEFAKVYAEDHVAACKTLFLIGDVREGDGERRTFNLCMDYLAKDHPQVAAALIPLIPEYTRWDNAVRLMVNKDPVVAEAASSFVEAQLKEDIKAVKSGEKASLLCKWLPHASAKKKADGTRTEKQQLNKNVVVKLKKDLGISEKEYRLLRKNLQENCRSYIVEMDLSAKKEISEENFSKIPSKANLKYTDALQRNAAAAYDAYLDRVASGEEKINADVLQPHEIVNKYSKDPSVPWAYSAQTLRQESKALETLWKALPDKVADPEGKGQDTIVIRDGSGSMTRRFSEKSKATCLDIATSLSIYFAERQQGELQDKFITFSSRPEVVDMSRCETLRDKLILCGHYDDCSNTDIKKTFDLMLDTYKKNNTPQDKVAKNVLIVSDMEFDDATYKTHYNYTHHYEQEEDGLTSMEAVQKEWKEEGYDLPRLIFWNVNSERVLAPILDNEHGIVMLSGFSTNNLDMVLSGEFDKEVEIQQEVLNEETGEMEMETVAQTVTMTPKEQLEARIAKERYDAVEEAAREGIELDIGENSREIAAPQRNRDVLESVFERLTEELDNPEEHSSHDDDDFEL